MNVINFLDLWLFIIRTEYIKLNMTTSFWDYTFDKLFGW